LENRQESNLNEKEQERTTFHRGAIIEIQLSCEVFNWKYLNKMNSFAWHCLKLVDLALLCLLNSDGLALSLTNLAMLNIGSAYMECKVLGLDGDQIFSASLRTARQCGT
jgi:hypothetical protein